MITCTGSIALDTTRTREQTIERALGGAAAFFSYSASFFSPTRLVAVVGDDFPQAHWNLLKGKGIDLKGVERRGKTFFIDWNYSADGRERTTNCIELNCLADFKPSVPEEWRDSEIVYLGTIPPSQQLKMLDQMRAPKLALMDTIEYYIENDLSNLKKTIAAVDAVLVNDGEARKYSRQTELRKAAEAILDQGPRMVLIKKGSDGCELHYWDETISVPAFVVQKAVDPTGAGDSFAGGFVGHLARAGNTDLETLKEALAYGSVMGSFAVEDFGLNKLVSLTPHEIETRFKTYSELLNSEREF